MQAPVWEEKLSKFITVFAKRREQFEFALTIHISRAVDEANNTLRDVARSNEDMRMKMNAMYELLHTLASPDHKKLAAVVVEKGGAAACQLDENILTELSQLEPKDDDGVGRRSKSSVVSK